MRPDRQQARAFVFFRRRLFRFRHGCLIILCFGQHPVLAALFGRIRQIHTNGAASAIMKRRMPRPKV